jgi:nucleoid-associated protein YgaU
VGLFDFVREAGAKIGIGESKAEKAAKAEAASAERAAEMAKRVAERKARVAARKEAEEMKQLAADTKANGLETYIKAMGFEVDDLDIRFQDGLATISGKVKDQQTRERLILAVGNVQDVGQVSDDIEVADPSEESDLHMVQSGDTLSAIAKKYYGDAGRYPEIFEANKPMLTDPDLIYPGQVLRIPGIG